MACFPVSRLSVAQEILEPRKKLWEFSVNSVTIMWIKQCLHYINGVVTEACIFVFTQEMGRLTAPAQHVKLIPGWKCEDTAGSCHMPQDSEEPSSPDQWWQKKRFYLIKLIKFGNTHIITYSECNYTDLFKEHSFCAGAVFADFIHALVFPRYFQFLLQGCHNMTKYYCCKLSKIITCSVSRPTV